MTYLSYPEQKTTKTPLTLYQYLSLALLSGQLNLPIEPPAALLRLPNPLDANENEKIRFHNGKPLHHVVHDASFYKNKFYLYFGTLPVLTFFIPFKLITGVYPADSLVILFFLSLGFIFNYLLLIKIKEQYFPNLPHFQIVFAGLLLGFANNSLFLLARPKMYEAAIACAFAFISMALYFLFRFIQQHGQKKNIFLFSLFLSLSIASRPNFLIVTMALIFMMSLYLFINVDKKYLFSKMMCLILPFISICTLLAIYNYLRFDSIFEFGTRYQLLASESGGNTSIFHQKHFDYTFIFGLYNYFFRLPTLNFDYPYIHFVYRVLDSHVINYYGYLYESSAGVFATAPFLAIIFLLPGKLRGLYQNHAHFKKLLWFILCLALIPMISAGLFVSLSICTQRYISDFLPYFVLLAILSVWLLDGQLNFAEQKRVNRFYKLSGALSIYIGFSFGFCLQTISLSPITFKIFSYPVILNFNYCILIMVIFIVLFAVFTTLRKKVDTEPRP
jgi:hypothetical protein